MKYIYIDNYRGFTDTIISIQDVNFLVGENSTGKTSFLGLLKLISSKEFWFSNELDARRVGFGTFKDIISINTENKTSFSVGIIYDNNKNIPMNDELSENKELCNITAVLMTFTEKEGMPRISRMSIYNDFLEFKLRYFPNTVKYKKGDISNIDCADDFINNHFNKWVNTHKFDNSGFLELENHLMRTNTPPIFIISQLFKQHSKKSDKASFRFSIPSFIPSFIDDMVWLAPIRSKPKKTYDEFSLDFSPEGDHIPYLIKKKLDSKSDKFKKFLHDFGIDSGLFKEIVIKKYGRGTTAPFELDVVLNDAPLSVSSVGYGISQLLPVIVEIFLRTEQSWFAVQQPEVHLHPKAQAALGDVFFRLAVHDNKKFIIETHSDYLIDRFRIACRKNNSKINSQVLFFERINNKNTATSINIDYTGSISSNQPDSYRDFFVKEEMNILGL